MKQIVTKIIFCSQIAMFGLFRENVRIAMGSIRTQLLRTILTVLIIAIGITALVGILTVVSALENTLSKDFASMGSNTFSFTSESRLEDRRERNKESENPVFTFAESKEFKEKFKFPLVQTATSFTASSAAEVKFENEKTDPEVTVIGTDENYMSNSGLEVVKGRNFTDFDIQNNNFVCILGADFEKNLLAEVNPIDKTVSIRGAKFKVIGVLKEKGSTFGNSQDLRAYIPIQVARTLFTTPNVNYMTSVMVKRKEMLEQAIDHALVTMRNVRKLSPVEKDNFSVSRSDDLINKILDITKYLDIAAWVIGVITIFGSSIALMNIMLVSVTERTREIGTRKALGAKRSTIAMQFFMETIVIGQLGGLVGTILGILIGFGFASLLEFKFAIPWLAITSAFVACFVVAVVSGLYPAVKAAKLDPIEALRYE